MLSNQIKVFNSPQFGQVRTAGTSDNPQFCLADICKALDLHPNVVRQRLNDDVCSTYPITDSLGREQVANFVNEDGLYDVILDSRKPEAKQFRKWVTSEVLPSIRKTGGYIASSAEDSPEEIMARALLVAQDTIKRKEERLHLLERQNRAQESLIVEKDETIAHQSEVIREQADKVEKYDIIYNGHACYRVSQLATMFGFRSAVALNKVLKDLKIQHYINGQWILNADYQGKGYTHVVTNSHECSDGSRRNTALTVWTEPGRVFLYEKLKKAGYIK